MGHPRLLKFLKKKKKQIQQVWGDTFCYSRRRRPLLVSGAWLQQQLISYLLLLEKYRNVGLYLSSGSARSQAFRHVGRRTDELPAPSHLQVIFFLFFYFTSNEKALGAKVRPSGMKPVCRQAMKLLLWPREIFTTPEGRVSNALSGRTVHIFLLPQLRLPLAGIPSVTLRHSVRTLSSFSSPRSFFFVCCVDSPKGATVHQPFI